MARKTKLMVYVDRLIMEKPPDLFNAVIEHMIKKELDNAQRKTFMAEYMKAPTDQLKLKVIGEWVDVRDAAKFPFRYEKNATAQEQESDENQGSEGGVSVDDGSDGEQEQGDASVGCDPRDQQDDVPDGERGEADGGDPAAV